MRGDDRCPEGVNYADWLMNVVAPHELSPDNILDIIEYSRERRAQGSKPKKHIESKPIDLKKLGFNLQPKVTPIKRVRLK